MSRRTKWLQFPSVNWKPKLFREVAKLFQHHPADLADRCCRQLSPADLDLFHNAVEPIFKVAQCFAIMPLVNISGPHPQRVQFRFNTFGFFVAGVFLFCGGVMFLLFAADVIRAGVNINNFVGLVFFSCGLSACTLFLRLAQRWPVLIANWTRVEMIFLKPPYKPNPWTLSHKIRLSACIIAALFAVEHAMFFASEIYGYRMMKLSCNDTGTPASYEDYVREHFTFIFSHIPYHISITFPLLYLNTTFTFIWNYMDLFIMLISFGLAARFQQIGQRTESLSGVKIPQSTWLEIRDHYGKLCDLLETVDEHMASIILLSSANNLYFICYQILNIFNTLRWPINYVYFWYSLMYLIGRTVFVFLCASKINDESKVPLRALRSVPADGWGDEVERFSMHITEDCVALSGRKLFFITRKLIFGMAATIVTYELVLLQFEELSSGRDLPPLCG